MKGLLEERCNGNWNVWESYGSGIGEKGRVAGMKEWVGGLLKGRMSGAVTGRGNG